MITYFRTILIVFCVSITSIYSQNKSENIIKIAHLQISAIDNSIEQNMQKAELYFRKADFLDADLAVLPELYSIGYTDFDKKIDGAKEEWLSQAIDDTSYFVNHFVELAKKLDMALAITFLEAEKNQYYNTMIVIDRFGKICLKHRKVHLWEKKTNDAACTSGSDFYVCELNTKNGSFKLGAMICADYYFPESARILMLKGAEIVIVTNAAPINSHTHALLKARAIENAFGISLTNYPYKEGCTYCCSGRSTAINPYWWGKSDQIFLVDHSEGIFTAEFNLNEIRKYRNNTYFGNAFRHPKLYQLLSDTTVNEPFKGRKTALDEDFSKHKR